MMEKQPANEKPTFDAFSAASSVTKTNNIPWLFIIIQFSQYLTNNYIFLLQCSWLKTFPPKDDTTFLVNFISCKYATEKWIHPSFWGYERNLTPRYLLRALSRIIETCNSLRSFVFIGQNFPALINSAPHLQVEVVEVQLIGYGNSL